MIQYPHLTSPMTVGSQPNSNTNLYLYVHCKFLRGIYISETTHNGNRYMKTYNPPGVSCQKKNRLTDAPAPAAAPRGANVAKQPGTAQRLGRLYVITIERLS